ncbi:unnamed protein product [Pieris macdunnoughi]|uniref:Uncharacterized protein n=1 Tax=Pieris macdunnoughi TaxID=345717 RepID=A0A821XYA0_9NEOP|nr:unnamed protein product [Pieris macdunnoughi]
MEIFQNVQLSNIFHYVAAKTENRPRGKWNVADCDAKKILGWKWDVNRPQDRRWTNELHHGKDQTANHAKDDPKCEDDLSKTAGSYCLQVACVMAILGGGVYL